MKKEELNIPFQVEALINNMLNNKDNVYVRANYKNRLLSIKDAIDKSIKKYDNELYLSNMQGNRRTKG